MALLHDWLLGMRGGERCLELLCEMFPHADVFTLFYREGSVTRTIEEHFPETSFLGKLPGVRRYYRALLPLFPSGVWDLGRRLSRRAHDEPYDLVISVSHCAVKNVSVPKETRHLCYCLTPMRYIWDQYDAYFSKSPVEPLMRRVAHRLREWDVSESKNVGQFIAISEYIARRIERVYNRQALVIYPPVRTDWITPRREGEVGEGFLAVNALVPYKNVELLVAAFNSLGEHLTIVGSGPGERELKRNAGPNIKFVGSVTDAELAELYRRSKALVFAAEEDFGMAPVETQAAGRPVIALGRGGALETVNVSQEIPTGVFFSEPTVASLTAAVRTFLDQEGRYTVDNCLRQAQKFSAEEFQKKFFQVTNGTTVGNAEKTLAAL